MAIPVHSSNFTANLSVIRGLSQKGLLEKEAPEKGPSAAIWLSCISCILKAI